MGPVAYLRCFNGILQREAFRFFQQTGRLFAALVRPLVWLLVFATGFRNVMGFPSSPPYLSYVEYDVYITPGLLGMILLFNGMQTSLSMVYDREMGSMKTLLSSPLPRWFLLTAKLISGTFISIMQCYAYLLIASLWIYYRLGSAGLPPWGGYLTLFPALLLCGVMVGAMGLYLSSMVRQLENFAGVMNFFIFPMFFISTALYPLWQVKLSSQVMHVLAYINPFTHIVELLRFALYTELNVESLIWVCTSGLILLCLAIWGYDATRGNLARKGV
jgi:ABC-2 type transport system permease protein